MQMVIKPLKNKGETEQGVAQQQLEEKTILLEPQVSFSSSPFFGSDPKRSSINRMKAVD